LADAVRGYGAAVMGTRVGSGRRAGVIVVLACVLALESADAATIGATAPQLKESLGIGNTQIGLLVSVSTGVGALATLPAGALTDRVNRTRMLAAAVLTWSLALAVGGLAASYLMLVCTRVAGGAVVATAGPVTASLIGDYFPVAERGRVYGTILSGELVGTAVGLVLSGDVAAAWSWRFAFGLMAAAGVALAWVILRHLPEPARRSDPSRKSLWWAVRYVLSIPTNRVLIMTSALGFFFFSGLRTFAEVLLRDRYGAGPLVVNAAVVVLGLGAIAGTVTGGRVADRLLARERLSARPVVAGCAFSAAALLFVPALATTSTLVAAPLFLVAAACLGGANAPLDAARLDLVPSRLWGRAEAVRTVLRYALGAVAPVLFGWVSTRLGAPGAPAAGGHAAGLAETFIVMAAPLLLSGLLILVWARRTYPADVATARASDRNVDPVPAAPAPTGKEAT
jgi:predicted MFS family arabinose efflux permease